MTHFASNPSPWATASSPLTGIKPAAGVSDISAEARQRLVEAGEIVKNVVNNRPVLAIGAALAAGVLLGWLIKRR